MITDRKNYIGGPDYFKISGPDRGPDRKIFYLVLTKTSFFSNSLTERARQVWTLFWCILVIGIGTGRFVYISILLTCDFIFVFYDGIAIHRKWPILTLDRAIAVANTDVWCDGERRRNTDAPIDDPDIVSVDRSENVDKSTTGSASDWHR
jgi:hypothetical protein